MDMVKVDLMNMSLACYDGIQAYDVDNFAHSYSSLKDELHMKALSQPLHPSLLNKV
jgi:hypothetical protein